MIGGHEPGGRPDVFGGLDDEGRWRRMKRRRQGPPSARISKAARDRAAQGVLRIQLADCVVIHGCMTGEGSDRGA